MRPRPRRHRHGADEPPAGRTRMPRARRSIAGSPFPLGGEPKCCKSFVALDIAVAVAPASPACAASRLPRSGRVMLYAAEDALHIVRRRFDGICEAARVALADLDIQVITAPTLLLDLDADRNSLADTVARLQPRLLILDPFVRLHRIDENASGEVAPLLAYLRELQRRYGVALLEIALIKPGQILSVTPSHWLPTLVRLCFTSNELPSPVLMALVDIGRSPFLAHQPL